MRISDWSSDVCSSDLVAGLDRQRRAVDEVVDRDQRLQLAAEAFLIEQLDRGRRQRRGVAALGGERKLVLPATDRSEEHTSELQSLMRISYAVFCLKKKNNDQTII